MKISVKKMALAMALTAMPMMGFAGNKGPEWLSKAVAYQIYPSSYQDSDGDGIGDIPGITSRLDYIKGLGVNVIWLNPVFVSGWFDGGYDIIDFYKVDPRFGTNTDLVKLIDEAHKRGIRVLLDLVAGTPATSANGSRNRHKAPICDIATTTFGATKFHKRK